MAGYRISGAGSRIDRSRIVHFTFDGQRIAGYAGDTAASALLGAGRTLLARSFKYHRPRGVFTAGSEEPSALLTVGTRARREPNTKATVIEVADGMALRSQNAWPSLGFDLGTVNERFGRFFGAGFYYKTFMGPFRGSWMLYEPFIRRAAGLGAASLEPDPDRYETANGFCDVLVVGGGAAGLAAALAAGRTGARVILADEQPVLGGSLDLEDSEIAGKRPADWVAATLDALRAMPNVRLMTRLTVYGYYDDNVLAAFEQLVPAEGPFRADATVQRHWRMEAKRVVLAAGSIERPFVLAGNDKPGVMLAGAALAYLRRFGVAVGRDVVVFTNNDLGWNTAAALARGGVSVRAVADPRGGVPDAAARFLAQSGAECLTGHVVIAAHGKRSVGSVEIAAYDRYAGRASDATRTIRCDALLMSAGHAPTIHLASQAGGVPVYDEQLAAFLPGEPREAWAAAGAIAGSFDVERAVADGERAGAEAAARSRAGGQPGLPLPSTQARDSRADPFPLFEITTDAKSFVDFQNDVTVKDVRLAKQEGFESVEHLKRYTTLGMATDQGKTSNLNGLTVMALERGVPVPAVGSTRFRPPYNPVSLGALVGRSRGGHMQPHRRVPLHAWHVENGGDMMNVGLWQRPRAYLRRGETLQQAYIREARAVRRSVGITDVTTLGKIDVQGPDAAAFLDRVYTNTFSTLQIGKARYGLMLRDDGFLYDDGTTWRLSETRFLMTTTTANAGLVMQQLEFLLAVAWPDLKVAFTSVTDQWAGTAVSGPNSRALLEAAVDLDMSDEAFPFMGVRAGSLDGIPVLVARLSFSGEMAYEVYCSADHALGVWTRLLEAGRTFDVIPYGLEALGTLRIEKGHVTGAEMDGRTTVHDLGLEKMFSMKKDFVGKALALRPDLISPNRKQLVGVRALDGKPIRGGAHLVSGSDARKPGRSEGHVTAMTFSPVLETYIALALLERGRSRHGERMSAADPVRRGFSAVEIVDPVFFDKDGSRMHG